MKEFDITNEGWPVAQPRFTRRPSASTKIECPSGKVNLSTCGLILVFHGARLFEPRHLYLVVEVADVADDRLIAHPLHMLQRDDVAIARAGHENIAFAESALSTVFTSKPSIAACRAQIGSISVTITRAPYERIDAAQPLPTSP